MKPCLLAVLAIALTSIHSPLIRVREASQTQQDSGSKAAPVTDQKPTAEASSAPLPDSKGVEVLTSKKADFPWEARQKQIQGEVIVEVIISQAGTVERARAISGDPILAQAALEAAKKWTFKPYIKNGRPAKVATRIPFDFTFAEKIMTKGEAADWSATTEFPKRPAVSSTGSANSDSSSRFDAPSGVIQGLLIRQIAPVYPPSARRDHIEGKVILQVDIDKEGRIENLTLLSGPKVLAAAAIGAVQQWRYKPYLLGGEPVRVRTQVEVNFKLGPF
ncbi:MAG TPA: energy transducer TonB [Verrucomicrobiae bacterium]|nr:energy transducer TonB [Verrucomicrobiae bacterium]